MAEDDFVDVGLRKLFRFDTMLLASAEQIVEESHVELEYFDEFDDAAVGDVEFAVKVKGPRVAIAAVEGDFSIVDVAG